MDQRPGTVWANAGANTIYVHCAAAKANYISPAAKGVFLTFRAGFAGRAVAVKCTHPVGGQLG